jgi:N-acetylglutamate synthase-like GNAT family acetyltransferase
MTDIEVREAGPDDADYITATLVAEWHDTAVVARSELVDLLPLPTLIAWSGAERVGCLHYRTAGKSCEAVSLIATVPRIGAGTALLRAIRDIAVARHLDRVWLVTTNENTGSLAFYQRFGFDLVELRHNVMAAARELKPSIPLRANGIPIRHELVLELIP